jgi:DNA-directed RNA polymerase specialized sigma24 family protein
MAVQEREVVVLARLGGCEVLEVARTLGIEPEDVRARMRSALHAPATTGVS